MSARISVDEYLAGGEVMRPQELAFGVLREPAAPGVQHQIIVGRIFGRLDGHVRRVAAGRVVVSPIDVILDRDRALVVQPDVVFVSTDRLDICAERIWGAPDLCVEVLSTSGRRHDRIVKVDWYRRYGVAECWVVDPVAREVEVVDLRAAERSSAVFAGSDRVRSAVLPRLRLPVDRIFEP